MPSALTLPCVELAVQGVDVYGSDGDWHPTDDWQPVVWDLAAALSPAAVLQLTAAVIVVGSTSRRVVGSLEGLQVALRARLSRRLTSAYRGWRREVAADRIGLCVRRRRCHGTVSQITDSRHRRSTRHAPFPCPLLPPLHTLSSHFLSPTPLRQEQHDSGFGSVFRSLQSYRFSGHMQRIRE